MKKSILTFCILVMAGMLHLPAEEAEKTAPEKIGLSVNLDYASNYLWRGTYWYEDGAFFPGINYTLGPVTVGYIGEFSEDAVLDNKPVTKSDGSTKVKDLHSSDFGIKFSHVFGNMITLGASYWYYLFHNCTGLSYMTATVSFTLSGIPLSPFIAYNHDIYTGDDIEHRAEDFYIQTGISHSIELMKNVNLNLGLAGGLYRAKTTDQTGVSDIAASAGLNVALDYVSIYGSFNYVIVPGKDFYKLADGTKDINRFYATTGVSCGI